MLEYNVLCVGKMEEVLGSGTITIICFGVCDFLKIYTISWKERYLIKGAYNVLQSKCLKRKQAEERENSILNTKHLVTQIYTIGFLFKSFSANAGLKTNKQTHPRRQYDIRRQS